MNYIYQVHTLHGTYIGFTYDSAEKAQAKCEELSAANNGASYTFYKEKVL